MVEATVRSDIMPRSSSTSPPDRSGLRSVADLREIYPPPRSGPVEKVIHGLDHHCAQFLRMSPFLVLSTANVDGVCDGSPRGGHPGFARVLDAGHLAWGDLSGNNRLDSFQNIVSNPRVAVLFLVPGLDETLRVNGSATLSTDQAMRQEFAVGGKDARVVVMVEVEEAYVHCAKSLRRSGIWSPASWPDPEKLPSAACIVKDHASLEGEVEEIEAARENDLRATLWEPGGRH